MLGIFMTALWCFDIYQSLKPAVNRGLSKNQSAEMVQLEDEMGVDVIYFKVICHYPQCQKNKGVLASYSSLQGRITEHFTNTGSLILHCKHGLSISCRYLWLVLKEIITGISWILEDLFCFVYFGLVLEVTSLPYLIIQNVSKSYKVCIDP